MFFKNKIIQWAFAISCTMAILSLSFIRLSPALTPPGQIPHLDKIVHLLMYFGLYISWCSVSLFNKHYRYFLFVSIVSFGALIEYYQPILSSRNMDFFDGLFNAMGAFFGLMFSTIVIRRKAHIEARDARHNRKFAAPIENT